MLKYGRSVLSVTAKRFKRFLKQKGTKNRNPTRLGPTLAHNERQAYSNCTRPSAGNRAPHVRTGARSKALLQIATARANAVQDAARVRSGEQQRDQAHRRAEQDALLELFRTHAGCGIQPERSESAAVRRTRTTPRSSAQIHGQLLKANQKAAT